MIQRSDTWNQTRLLVEASLTALNVLAGGMQGGAQEQEGAARSLDPSYGLAQTTQTCEKSGQAHPHNFQSAKSSQTSSRGCRCEVRTVGGDVNGTQCAYASVCNPGLAALGQHSAASRIDVCTVRFVQASCGTLHGTRLRHFVASAFEFGPVVLFSLSQTNR